MNQWTTSDTVIIEKRREIGEKKGVKKGAVQLGGPCGGG